MLSRRSLLKSAPIAPAAVSGNVSLGQNGPKKFSLGYAPHPGMSCKILFDLYHQQITEGDLIENIDASWTEIAYFQSADNPGRKEPYTGEIHYRGVFDHLRSKGYTGVIGMEHGNSVKGVEGEQKVIQAYRMADAGA